MPAASGWIRGTRSGWLRTSLWLHAGRHWNHQCVGIDRGQPTVGFEAVSAEVGRTSASGAALAEVGRTSASGAALAEVGRGVGFRG